MISDFESRDFQTDSKCRLRHSRIFDDHEEYERNMNTERSARRAGLLIRLREKFIATKFEQPLQICHAQTPETSETPPSSRVNTCAADVE